VEIAFLHLSLFNMDFPFKAAVNPKATAPAIWAFTNLGFIAVPQSTAQTIR
jgi:hypothetical protein